MRNTFWQFSSLTEAFISPKKVKLDLMTYFFSMYKKNYFFMIRKVFFMHKELFFDFSKNVSQSVVSKRGFFTKHFNNGSCFSMHFSCIISPSGFSISHHKNVSHLIRERTVKSRVSDFF